MIEVTCRATPGHCSASIVPRTGACRCYGIGGCAATPSVERHAEPKRDPSSGELPRPLIYATALTCGVLAAWRCRSTSARIGFDLVSLGQTLFSGAAPQLRTAGPGGRSPGLAFIVGGADRRRAQPASRCRGGAFACCAGRPAPASCSLLADIGHSRRGPEAAGAGAHAGGEPGGARRRGADGDARRLFHRRAPLRGWRPTFAAEARAADASHRIARTLNCRIC